MKKKKKKGTGMILFGLLLLAAALLLSGYNYLDGLRAEKEALKIAGEMISEFSKLEKNNNPYAGLSSEEETYREMETMEIDGYRYIGLLEIPSLDGLTLPIMEEWDDTRLKTSPCRYEGNYYYDDLIIAGHNYARHFSPIKWLEPGTDIYFTNPSGETFHYQLEYIEKLYPKQVDDLLAGEWDLTLFTCYKSGGSRCVLRCRRVK